MVENMFVPLNVPLMFKLTRKTNLPACQREPKGRVTSLFHPDYRRGESYLPFCPIQCPQQSQNGHSLSPRVPTSGAP